jgi:hypothetical protein
VAGWRPALRRHAPVDHTLAQPRTLASSGRRKLMANGRCRMRGGKSLGAPKGNSNALKHGRYTAEAIARRREIGALWRVMKHITKL